MAEAHNHHYVPQGYLRGFADGIGRKARVFTVDLVDGKSFTTLVRNVAAVRDFNRIDIDGHDPNSIEQAYASFEGPTAEALARIREVESFDDPDDRLHVLNLIALLATRNPRLRGKLDAFTADIGQAMAEMMTSSKERWDATISDTRTGTGDPTLGAATSYEEMRHFVRSKAFNVKMHQNFHVGIEIESMDTVLQTLLPRKWRLYVAAAGAGEFITSDHPVVLVSTRPNDTSPFGVGYGMTETAVLFPVGRRLFLTGTFEGTDEIKPIGRRGVALLNAQLVARATRQVYAHDDSFSYSLDASALQSGRELALDIRFRRAPPAP